MNSDSVFRDRARQHVGMDGLMNTRTWASSFDSRGSTPCVTLMPHGGQGRWLAAWCYFLFFTTFNTHLFHFSIKSMCELWVVCFAGGISESFPMRRTPFTCWSLAPTNSSVPSLRNCLVPLHFLDFPPSPSLTSSSASSFAQLASNLRQKSPNSEFKSFKFLPTIISQVVRLKWHRRCSVPFYSPSLIFRNFKNWSVFFSRTLVIQNRSGKSFCGMFFFFFFNSRQWVSSTRVLFQIQRKQ